jgi:hypothetical protein
MFIFLRVGLSNQYVGKILRRQVFRRRISAAAGLESGQFNRKRNFVIL